MRVEFLFAWYDIWVGAFWDSNKRWLYILPLPMVGFILKFPHPLPKCSICETQTELDSDDILFCPRDQCNNYYDYEH